MGNTGLNRLWESPAFQGGGTGLSNESEDSYTIEEDVVSNCSSGSSEYRYAKLR